MSNDIFLYRVCNRCRNQLKYISSTYFKKIVSENPNECKYCKAILDENLDAFKQSVYSRACPKCGKTITHKSRYTLFQAVRENRLCKSCGLAPVFVERAKAQREYWEPIIGRWNLRPKTFAMIKKHWRTLTEEQKVEIMGKTQLQKDYYWGHLRRKNRHSQRRNCRATLAERYGGENHWMKRPEVLAKIRKTCEKYRGDGHWFRRNRKTQ